MEYKKGSLFDAPEDYLLVHACNAQGVWGKGIAKQFKDKNPAAYETYKFYCDKYDRLSVGTCFVTNGVGCLITSYNYDKNVDSVNQILRQTDLAIEDLCNQGYKKIASNKFNSGLFKVPWELTEEIIKDYIKRYKLDWIVYEL